MIYFNVPISFYKKGLFYPPNSTGSLKEATKYLDSSRSDNKKSKTVFRNWLLLIHKIMYKIYLFWNKKISSSNSYKVYVGSNVKFITKYSEINCLKCVGFYIKMFWNKKIYSSNSTKYM